VQEGILQLLLRLQQEFDITYLFISHDIAVVRAISDEIVVMFQGKVVEQGLKSDILSPPHPEYTELLLSSVPEMSPDWLDQVVKTRTV
jgi:peptide/nickel transport system ATP-binding protein